MKPLFVASFLCLFSAVNGQFVEPKFGKIELSDLSMSKYDKDTTAAALILFDNGTSVFILNNEQKFQFQYDRHFQIKIFKKSAFSAGNFSIRLYKVSTSKEDIRNLKGVTYNLVDGKTVKTKLDNDQIFRAAGKNYTDVNFALPEIKEGSIIELTYSIVSDYLYNFRGWTFQYDYPARWSQYYYEFPEYFKYRESSKGYLQFDVNKKEPGYVTFSIPMVTVVSRGTIDKYEPAQSQLIRASTLKSTLGIKDVPAFSSEPEIDCENNYLQSIEFELNTIQLPGSMLKEYTQSWESVNTQMTEDEDFGELLKANDFIKDTLKAVCKNMTRDLDKAVSIYNYVQKRMKWNGEYKKWATKGLKKPFAEGVGSSCEINMLLTLMLQTAGIKSDPVLFSTRDNGIAITNYPTISKFNSVLSRVEIDGKEVLLDAISKYCPFGVLPANDINGKGRVVNNSGGDWAELKTNDKYNEIKKYDLTISTDGNLTGAITSSYSGYAGMAYRKSINSATSTDEYFRKMQENLKGLTINKYTISNKSDNYKPSSDSLNVDITDQIEIVGDKILFDPLLFEKIEKNRYTLEDRKYPVDYNYPISENYTFIYTLPKGYQVESLPESVELKLPDNSISISYSLKSADNKIKVQYRRDVNKMLFMPNQYVALKDFYDKIVKKHAEQIILKKTI